MKKISQWAKAHKKLSRIIIIASFVVLTALGITTGLLLTEIDFSFFSSALFLFFSIYFAGILAYPEKSLKRKRLSVNSFYWWQKSCDFTLAASTFCMIVFLSNQPQKIFNYSITLHAATMASSTLPKDSTVKSYKTIDDFKASLKDENGNPLKWKEKKKLLKEQVRAIKKDNELSNGAKTALIVLSVVVALGLLFLITALACELSCNGSEGAAIAVAIGGAGLVAFLLVVVIRAILGKKKKPKVPVDQPLEAQKPS